MAGLKGRLSRRRRHGGRLQSLSRLPLIDGDIPAAEAHRLSGARGVVISEGGKYYLVRRDMLAGSRSEGSSGEVARRHGTPLKSRRSILSDKKKADSFRFSESRGEWRVGEATLNKNLDMVGAGMRSPVALVVCEHNAAHIYVAKAYQSCPRDGGKLVRLERS